MHLRQFGKHAEIVKFTFFIYNFIYWIQKSK